MFQQNNLMQWKEKVIEINKRKEEFYGDFTFYIPTISKSICICIHTHKHILLLFLLLTSQ